MKSALIGLACLFAFSLDASGALADDRLVIAVGQRGAWETAMPDLGQKAGFFKKRGLDLDILYTQGGGETQQIVIAGSADIGTGVGTSGVLGAFQKGAPIRILSAQATGPADFWYVKASSPVVLLKDYKEPVTVAYSTSGSSVQMALLRFIKAYDLKARPVATGGPQATLTQLMSGQIDVGWSTPPLAIAQIDSGELRIVGRVRDLPQILNQTVRVNIVNAQALEAKHDAVRRFMQAYRDTLAWMYDDPKAMNAYAAYSGFSVALATRVRDEFFPRAMLDPDRIVGMDTTMADAVEYKALAKPLTPDELKTAIQAQQPL